MEHNVFVVGYWSHVELITTDIKKAEVVLQRAKVRSPDLPWEIRSVEDAINHAYKTGYEDGLEENF